jgi:hypothetical protein
MASCEMILDPQTDSAGALVENAPQDTAVAPRLLTVEEAVAIERQTERNMPADLLLADAAAFISSQQ